MRLTATFGLAGVILCALFSSGAHSQTGKCGAGPDAIGVSRVVEIDTSDGPRFGHLQFKDIDFLRDGEVVLTFDDGPLRKNTRAVLDALDAHCTKATFFTVGRMAVSDPATLHEVALRGHTIGVHTWSHKNLQAISEAQAKTEIELGLSAVRAALGAPVAPFFRFPYLASPQKVQAYLQQRGFAIFSIDVDSYDYRTPSAATMQRNVLTQLAHRKKGIILFHDIQASTAQGLKDLLTELKARGFQVVHLVAKEPATTLADYDEMAEQALSGKRVAASTEPAKRPATPQLSAAPASVSTTVSAPVNVVSPQTKPSRPRYGEEPPWQVRVFQN
jgi:peptidoglycan/xylan/chitin deacetylase (PgdA/CDA1 family)